jgi:hypothetical protein
MVFLFLSGKIFPEEGPVDVYEMVQHLRNVVIFSPPGLRFLC